MALQPLPPGLAPDVVEKLRWQTFGHQRQRSIRSAPDLAHFTAARGFVLCAPEAGLHYPSVLEATTGRPLLEHAYDERGARADAWMRECVGAGQVMHGVVVAQRATLVDRSFVVDFFLTGVQEATGQRVEATVGLFTSPSQADAAIASAHIASRVERLPGCLLGRHVRDGGGDDA